MTVNLDGQGDVVSRLIMGMILGLLYMAQRDYSKST